MEKPKIVVWDLETIWDPKEWLREDRAFAMGNWPGRTLKADINSIMSFGYQILGEEPQCVSVWDYEHYTPDQLNDDYELCSYIYDVLKDADAIITHNGKRFDMKFLKTRLKKHGLPALPKLTHIDTCQTARSAYSLFSNRLKDLTVFLGVSTKISTGGKRLWTRIYQGDETAYEEMTTYCLGDVRATGECALAMREEIKNWPNMNIFNQTSHNCPTCGTHKVQKHGQRITKTAVKQRYRCNECGSISETNMDDTQMLRSY